MAKKLNHNQFKDLIKNLIIKESKNIKEDEDLGLWSDFDELEFDNDAMAAAKADMEDSGEEFVPLGQSQFEKNLDPTQFKADLTRAKLDLPNDQAELDRIRQVMNTKKNHEKKFGVGSLNEDFAGGINYSNDLASELKIKVGNLDSLTPYVANLGTEVQSDINGTISVFEDGRLIKKFKDVDAFLYGIGYAAVSALNEFEEDLNDDKEKAWSFNPKDLYSFLKDAMYAFMEGNEVADYAEAALILENELEKHFTISKKVNETFDTENTSMSSGKIMRPKDAEGQDITLKTRVEDVETGAVGRVVRFGVDDSGAQTVHIDWMQNFGGAIPKSITYPKKIVVRDDNRIVREMEIEKNEGIGHSHTIGKGQNIKPGNYPQNLKRVGLKEGLENAKAPSADTDDVFLVVNSAFNRAHYKDLIGKTFEDVPSYAQVKLIKPNDIETEKSKDYDPTEVKEDFDYATAEREFHNKTEMDDIQKFANKSIAISNLDEMVNLVYPNQKRIQSVIKSVKEELSNLNIRNNIVAATDDMDTTWIFEIDGIKDNVVLLTFTGTAK